MDYPVRRSGNQGFKKMVQTFKPEISKMGREQKIKNIDDYSRKMYGFITNLKEERGISSNRKTVKVLNEMDIRGYYGGKWYVKSLINLYKRCETLGISNNPTL